MKIFVQQLGGAEPWTLDVDSQATLSDLKTLIRDANRIDDTIVLQLVLNEALLETSMIVQRWGAQRVKVRKDERKRMDGITEPTERREKERR